MQRAIDVQLHYVVDLPIGESVIQKNLPFHDTFRDKRHLIILVAVTQLWKELQLCKLHYVVDHPKVGE